VRTLATGLSPLLLGPRITPFGPLSETRLAATADAITARGTGARITRLFHMECRTAALDVLCARAPGALCPAASNQAACEVLHAACVMCGRAGGGGGPELRIDASDITHVLETSYHHAPLESRTLIKALVQIASIVFAAKPRGRGTTGVYWLIRAPDPAPPPAPALPASAPTQERRPTPERQFQ